MTPETLKQLSDPQLLQVISTAQSLLQERTEKRRDDAMEQIRQIAATAKIQVRFDGARKAKANKPILRAGDRYVNPGDAALSYIIGKGKPPNWFVSLREKGKLPSPVTP